MTSPYRDSDPALPVQNEEVLLTTCDHIEGYRVVCYFGLIQRTVAYAAHQLGATLEERTRAFPKIRANAAADLIARAHELKGNAVTGVRFDSNCGDGIYEVTGYGTAVRIEPIPPSGWTK
ncbi:MAG: heavy metal-binding domain-containing protein [Polyangiaceae bacterium]|nr:heavy metal-binding domain-containing protein [Polyangiaceae bacterium]